MVRASAAMVGPGLIAFAGPRVSVRIGAQRRRSTHGWSRE